MNLFRKSKEVNFDDGKVIVYEMSAKSFLKFVRGEYKDDLALLGDHLSLKQEEIEHLSIEAQAKLLDEFLELNKAILDEKKSEGEELDEKK